MWPTHSGEQYKLADEFNNVAFKHRQVGAIRENFDLWKAETKEFEELLKEFHDLLLRWKRRLCKRVDVDCCIVVDDSVIVDCRGRSNCRLLRFQLGNLRAAVLLGAPMPLLHIHSPTPLPAG